MTGWWWSWALTIVGLTCFWLAGLGVIAYSIVYARNAYRWTKEHADASLQDG